MNAPGTPSQKLVHELKDADQREQEFLAQATSLLEKAHDVAHAIEERVQAAMFRTDPAGCPFGCGPHLQQS